MDNGISNVAKRQINKGGLDNILGQNPSFKTSLSNYQQYQFQVGDRVETYNHCRGTVVRVDNDESGVFIVVRFKTLYGEFAYDPYALKVIQ